MSPGPAREVHGSIVIFQHCTFLWRQPESGFQRIVTIEDHHCERCVLELVRHQMGFIFDDRRAPKR